MSDRESDPELPETPETPDYPESPLPIPFPVIRDTADNLPDNLTDVEEHLARGVHQIRMDTRDAEGDLPANVEHPPLPDVLGVSIAPMRLIRRAAAGHVQANIEHPPPHGVLRMSLPPVIRAVAGNLPAEHPPRAEQLQPLTRNWRVVRLPANVADQPNMEQPPREVPRMRNARIRPNRRAAARNRKANLEHPPRVGQLQPLSRTWLVVRLSGNVADQPNMEQPPREVPRMRNARILPPIRAVANNPKANLEHPPRVGQLQLLPRNWRFVRLSANVADQPNMEQPPREVPRMRNARILPLRRAAANNPKANQEHPPRVGQLQLLPRNWRFVRLPANVADQPNMEQPPREVPRMRNARILPLRRAAANNPKANQEHPPRVGQLQLLPRNWRFVRLPANVADQPNMEQPPREVPRMRNARILPLRRAAANNPKANQEHPPRVGQLQLLPRNWRFVRLPANVADQPNMEQPPREVPRMRNARILPLRRAAANNPKANQEHPPRVGQLQLLPRNRRVVRLPANVADQPNVVMMPLDHEQQQQQRPNHLNHLNRRRIRVAPPRLPMVVQPQRNMNPPPVHAPVRYRPRRHMRVLDDSEEEEASDCRVCGSPFHSDQLHAEGACTAKETPGPSGANTESHKKSAKKGKSKKKNKKDPGSSKK